MSSHEPSKARKCNNLLHLEYSIAGRFCLPEERDTFPFMPRACPSSASRPLAIPAEVGAGSASKITAHC